LVDQAIFEMEFEKLVKDRSLNIPAPPKVAGPQVMQQKEYRKLEIKIDPRKNYNKNFERYFVNDIQRLFPWLVPPPQPPKPHTPIKSMGSGLNEMSMGSGRNLPNAKGERSSTMIDSSQTMGETTVMSEAQPQSSKY
jgi:hypothetical protein